MILIAGMDDVLEAVGTQNYQLACSRYFEQTNAVEDEPIAITHPNEYFNESQDIITGGWGNVNVPVHDKAKPGGSKRAHCNCQPCISSVKSDYSYGQKVGSVFIPENQKLKPAAKCSKCSSDPCVCPSTSRQEGEVWEDLNLEDINWDEIPDA